MVFHLRSFKRQCDLDDLYCLTFIVLFLILNYFHTYKNLYFWYFCRFQNVTKHMNISFYDFEMYCRIVRKSSPILPYVNAVLTMPVSVMGTVTLDQMVSANTSLVVLTLVIWFWPARDRWRVWSCWLLGAQWDLMDQLTTQST